MNTQTQTATDEAYFFLSGYWMPYTCAKAICATFCASIAGALIPIFGEDFPSQCISIDAPDHGRMVIDPAIIAESAREAELFRRIYMNANSINANSQLPQHAQQFQQQHHRGHRPPGNCGGAVQGGKNCRHGSALPSPTSIPSPRLTRRALNVPQRYGLPHELEHESDRFEDGLRYNRVTVSPYRMRPEPDVRPGLEASSRSDVLYRGTMAYSPLSPPRSSGHGSSWTAVGTTHHPSVSQSHYQPSTSIPTSIHGRGVHIEGESPYYANALRSNPLLSAVPRFDGHNQRLAHQQHGQYHEFQEALNPRDQRLPSISLGGLPPERQGRPAASAHYHRDQTRYQASISHPFLADTTHGPFKSASKRPAAEVVDSGHEPDSSSEESSPAATTATSTTGTSLCSQVSASRAHGSSGSSGSILEEAPDGRRDEASTRDFHLPRTTGAEKNAALMLMNLSVSDNANGRRLRQEAKLGGSTSGCRSEKIQLGSDSNLTSPVYVVAGDQRSKRRRATSM